MGTAWVKQEEEAHKSHSKWVVIISMVKTVKFSNRVVINVKERNLGTKEKSSKKGLASSKDLNVIKDLIRLQLFDKKKVINYTVD